MQQRSKEYIREIFIIPGTKWNGMPAYTNVRVYMYVCLYRESNGTQRKAHKTPTETKIEYQNDHIYSVAPHGKKPLAKTL